MKKKLSIIAFVLIALLAITACNPSTPSPDNGGNNQGTEQNDITQVPDTPNADLPSRDANQEDAAVFSVSEYAGSILVMNESYHSITAIEANVDQAKYEGTIKFVNDYKVEIDDLNLTNLMKEMGVTSYTFKKGAEFYLKVTEEEEKQLTHMIFKGDVEMNGESYSMQYNIVTDFRSSTGSLIINNENINFPNEPTE